MDRGRARRCRTESQITVKKSAGVVVAEWPLTSAIFEARLEGFALPPIESHVAARVRTAVLGLHVQHAGIPKAVGDRQDPVEQAHPSDEKAIENLAESA